MIDLERFAVDPELQALISADVAKTQRAVPAARVDGVLFIAVDNPFGPDRSEYFNFLTRHKVELVMASTAQIDARLQQYGKSRSEAAAPPQRSAPQASMKPKSLATASPSGKASSTRDADSGGDGGFSVQDDASVVDLVNRIISDAQAGGASDIHLEAYYGDPNAYIRFRRDGRMEEYSHYPSSHHRAVISRMKIMANLDISERRLAQDGKISFSRDGEDPLELRLATIPTSRGIENVTIRLLHSGDPLPIEALNMCERDLEVFSRLIERPYGLLLVCGPTGSGKTTTLHSALRQINTPERKIWTAEDPVEILQKGVSQVQVNAKIGWTFAIALRSFLRADPDVIMIGEMRDKETANIAVEASMTGHVVLSTLHTNSASETTSRLIDLDVDPFNLADALLFILAQRLARKLCSECKTPAKLNDSSLKDLASEYHYSAYSKMASEAEAAAIIDDWSKRIAKDGDLSLWSAKGCDHCGGKGYRGRVALFELMEATPELRALVTHRSPASKYQEVAVEQGMRTLKQDGIEKCLLGLTDLSEVRGVCN